jgi:hypothetical protein
MVDGSPQGFSPKKTLTLVGNKLIPPWLEELVER